MKKIWLVLILVVVLLLALALCGKDNGSSSSSTSTSTSCKHSWGSANCEEPATCSKCQETKGTALGHTTDSGTCSRCGKQFSAWEVGEYVDEFQQPTGKKYMFVDAYGTFSNSATTNSKLYAAVQIDKNNIGIMLWEYGSSQVKGTFDYEDFNITILDEAGAKHNFIGTMYKGGTRIYLDDDDRNELSVLLHNNDTLKIYVKSTKYSISTYLFEIKTTGYAVTYNSIM